MTDMQNEIREEVYEEEDVQFSGGQDKDIIDLIGKGVVDDIQGGVKRRRRGVKRHSTRKTHIKTQPQKYDNNLTYDVNDSDEKIKGSFMNLDNMMRSYSDALLQILKTTGKESIMNDVNFLSFNFTETSLRNFFIQWDDMYQDVFNQLQSQEAKRAMNSIRSKMSTWSKKIYNQPITNYKMYMDNVEIKFNKYPSTIKVRSELEMGIKKDVTDMINKIITTSNNQQTIQLFKQYDERQLQTAELYVKTNFQPTDQPYKAFFQFKQLREQTINNFLQKVDVYEKLIKQEIESYKRVKPSQKQYDTLLDTFKSLTNDPNGKVGMQTLQQMVSRFQAQVDNKQGQTASGQEAPDNERQVDIPSFNFDKDNSTVTLEQINKSYKDAFANAVKYINNFGFLLKYCDMIAQIGKEFGMQGFDVKKVVTDLIVNYYLLLQFRIDKNQVWSRQLTSYKDDKEDGNQLYPWSQLTENNGNDFENSISHIMVNSINSLYGTFNLLIEYYTKPEKSLTQLILGAGKEQLTYQVNIDAYVLYKVMRMVHVNVMESVKNLQNASKTEDAKTDGSLKMEVILYPSSKYYKLYQCLEQQHYNEEYIGLCNKLWASTSGSTAGIFSQRLQNCIKGYIQEILDNLITKLYNATGAKELTEMENNKITPTLTDMQNLSSGKLYKEQQYDDYGTIEKMQVPEQLIQVKQDYIELYSHVYKTLENFVENDIKNQIVEGQIEQNEKLESITQYFQHQIKLYKVAIAQDKPIIFNQYMSTNQITLYEAQSLIQFALKVGVYLNQYMKMIENITKLMLVYHKHYVELDNEPYKSAINKVMSLRLKYANWSSAGARTPEDRIYGLCFDQGIFQNVDVSNVALSTLSKLETDIYNDHNVIYTYALIKLLKTLEEKGNNNGLVQQLLYERYPIIQKYTSTDDYNKHMSQIQYVQNMLFSIRRPSIDGYGRKRRHGGWWNDCLGDTNYISGAIISQDPNQQYVTYNNTKLWITSTPLLNDDKYPAIALQDNHWQFYDDKKVAHNNSGNNLDCFLYSLYNFIVWKNGKEDYASQPTDLSPQIQRLFKAIKFNGSLTESSQVIASLDLIDAFYSNKDNTLSNISNLLKQVYNSNDIKTDAIANWIITGNRNETIIKLQQKINNNDDIENKYTQEAIQKSLKENNKQPEPKVEQQKKFVLSNEPDGKDPVKLPSQEEQLKELEENPIVVEEEQKAEEPSAPAPAPAPEAPQKVDVKSLSKPEKMIDYTNSEGLYYITPKIFNYLQTHLPYYQHVYYSSYRDYQNIISLLTQIPELTFNGHSVNISGTLDKLRKMREHIIQQFKEFAFIKKNDKTFSSTLSYLQDALNYDEFFQINFKNFCPPPLDFATFYQYSLRSTIMDAFNWMYYIPHIQVAKQTMNYAYKNALLSKDPSEYRDGKMAIYTPFNLTVQKYNKDAYGIQTNADNRAQSAIIDQLNWTIEKTIHILRQYNDKIPTSFYDEMMKNHTISSAAQLSTVQINDVQLNLPLNTVQTPFACPIAYGIDDKDFPLQAAADKYAMKKQFMDRYNTDGIFFWNDIMEKVCKAMYGLQQDNIPYEFKKRFIESITKDNLSVSFERFQQQNSVNPKFDKDIPIRWNAMRRLLNNPDQLYEAFSQGYDQFWDDDGRLIKDYLVQDNVYATNVNTVDLAHEYLEQAFTRLNNEVPDKDSVSKSIGKVKEYLQKFVDIGTNKFVDNIKAFLKLLDGIGITNLSSIRNRFTGSYTLPLPNTMFQDKQMVNVMQQNQLAAVNDAVKAQIYKNLLNKTTPLIYDQESQKIVRFTTGSYYKQASESTLYMSTIFALSNQADIQYTEKQQYNLLYDLAMFYQDEIVKNFEKQVRNINVKQQAEILNILETLKRAIERVLHQIKTILRKVAQDYGTMPQAYELQQRMLLDPVQFNDFDKFNFQDTMKRVIVELILKKSTITIDYNLIRNFLIIRDQNIYMNQQGNSLPWSQNFKYFMKAAFIRQRTRDSRIVGLDHGWVLGNEQYIHNKQLKYVEESQLQNMGWDYQLKHKPNQFQPYDSKVINSLSIINIQDNYTWSNLFKFQYAYLIDGVVVSPQLLMQQINQYAGFTAVDTLTNGRELYNVAFDFHGDRLNNKESYNTQRLSYQTDSYLALLGKHEGYNADQRVDYMIKTNSQDINKPQMLIVNSVEYLYQALTLNYKYPKQTKITDQEGFMAEDKKLIGLLFRLLKVQPFNPILLIQKKLPFPILTMMNLYIKQYEHKYLKGPLSQFQQTSVLSDQHRLYLNQTYNGLRIYTIVDSRNMNGVYRFILSRGVDQVLDTSGKQGAATESERILLDNYRTSLIDIKIRQDMLEYKNGEYQLVRLNDGTQLSTLQINMEEMEGIDHSNTVLYNIFMVIPQYCYVYNYVLSKQGHTNVQSYKQELNGQEIIQPYENKVITYNGKKYKLVE